MSAEFPLPDLAWEPTRPFWEAAARGELVVPRCAGCGRYCWYPPERCPACEAGAPPWVRVSGRGTLFSWTLVQRGWVEPFRSLAPYLTGLVALAEDPAVRMVTMIVDCEAPALRVDMPMRAVFRPLPFPKASRQVVAPMFRPAA